MTRYSGSIRGVARASRNGTKKTGVAVEAGTRRAFVLVHWVFDRKAKCDRAIIGLEERGEDGEAMDSHVLATFTEADLLKAVRR